MIDYSKNLQSEAFVIFLFHGVIPSNKSSVRNYTKKHLETVEFEKVVSSLKLKGNPISMDDIILANQENRSLPPNSYAITFDDGFKNNLQFAAPILRKYETPATFYVTSGFIQNNDCSWTDLIEYAVDVVEEVTFKHNLLNTVYRVRSISDKISFLEKVRSLVKETRSIDPYEFAKDLWEQNSVNEFSPDPELDQKMSTNELCKLDSDPLFTVGGHSHTHRVLSFLAKEDLDTEVSKSTSFLKECLNKEIIHYSYPEGLAHCYDDGVINCLKDYGIICCPSAIEGRNNLNTDLFNLKRIFVV